LKEKIVALVNERGSFFKAIGGEMGFYIAFENSKENLCRVIKAMEAPSAVVIIDPRGIISSMVFEGEEAIFKEVVEALKELGFSC